MNHPLDTFAINIEAIAMRYGLIKVFPVKLLFSLKPWNYL